MTVPLDEINDIRSMDAEGVSRSEIARRLHLSRNTVAKYADMGGMSTAAPRREEGRPRALPPDDADWVESVLEADPGTPRKQRQTARRLYYRLVEERGYRGSYSTVQRHVRQWRLSRRSGGGEGYLELEWASGTAQVDFGNFEAVLAGERAALKLLVLTLPHSNAQLRPGVHVPALGVRVRRARGEAEAVSRDASRRAQLIRRCGLPAPKTFDGYDWSSVSWPDGLGRDGLLSLSFLERCEDLVLMGDVGTGKTRMASALCQLARDRRMEAGSSRPPRSSCGSGAPGTRGGSTGRRPR